MFSERDDGRLTFQEFVDLVSYTARVTPRADKLKLLFNLYDEVKTPPAPAAGQEYTCESEGLCPHCHAMGLSCGITMLCTVDHCGWQDADGFLTPPDMLQTLYNVLAGGYPWEEELNKQKEADKEGLKRDNDALTNFAKFLQVFL